MTMVFKLKIAFIPLILSLFSSCQGLECHNCYAVTGDLKDCQSLPYEELSAKIRWDNRITGGGLPPVSVARYNADACIKFETEFMDQNGGRQLAIVRTQIQRSASGLFVHDQYLTDTCSLRTDGVRVERGVTVTKRYCACTGDYCNGAPSKLPTNPALFFSIFICIFSYICFN